MNPLHKYVVPSAIAEHTLITPAQYQRYYQQSVQYLEDFWVEHGKILDWIKPY